MTRTWKLALCVMLAATLLAGCGGGEKPAVATPVASGKTAVQISPTEAADVKAANTPAGPIESAQDEELSVSDRQAGLEKLDSYRASWTLQWKSTSADKTEDVSWEWMQEYTREPKAAHWRWQSVDRGQPDAKPEIMEFWQIDTTTYIVTNNAEGQSSCVSTSSEDNKVDNSLTGPQTLGSVNDAKLVGAETVNGEVHGAAGRWSGQGRHLGCGRWRLRRQGQRDLGRPALRPGVRRQGHRLGLLDLGSSPRSTAS
jgi:hypothetical protein